MHVTQAHRAAPTGSTVAGPFAAVTDQGATVVEHTALFIHQVLDPALRQLVQDWDVVFTSGPPAAVQQPRDGGTDAVAAIGFVSRMLGVPVVDVLAAAGVRERTFHSWKAQHRTPRLASQGKLWLVVQMTEDLVALGPDALAWFHRNPEHRQLLREGQADELLRRYSDQRLRAVAPVTAPVIAAGFVGHEVVLDRMSEPRIPSRTRVAPRGFNR